MNKRWTFTLNNPGVTRPVWDNTKMDYLVYQLEQGEQGTQHLQGYVRFNSRKRLATALNILKLPGAHLEQAKGTEEQNRAYCTKEDTRIEQASEFGTFDASQGTQGLRTDLKKATEMIKSGSTLRDIATEMPETFVKYSKGLRELKEILLVPPASRDIEVRIIWGPTGTGKTHYVMSNYEDVFVVSPGRSPWDGYNGQSVLLFDEFDDAMWPINDMLKYLDKWRYECSARYYNKAAMWSTVFIVSNTDPARWYQFANPSQRDAFWRRVKHIEFKGEPYINTTPNTNTD